MCLLQSQELLLLHLDQASRHVMRLEAVLELYTYDGFLWVIVGVGIGLPLVKSSSMQLSRSIQDLLSVIALRNFKLAVHRLQLVISEVVQ